MSADRWRGVRFAIVSGLPLSGKGVGRLLDECDRLTDALAWLIDQTGDGDWRHSVPEEHTEAIAIAMLYGDVQRGQA